MKQDGIVFFHIRPNGYYLALENNDPKHTLVDDLVKEHYSRSATTFAFEKRADGNWYVAYSVCGKTDQFCRRVGRLVASGRLRCTRKSLAWCFGSEEPTFDDCIVLNNLIDHEAHWNRLTEFYGDNTDSIANILSSYVSRYSVPLMPAYRRVNKLMKEGMEVYA